MKISHLFSDFDGTLTDKGHISVHFHTLLSELKKKKIKLILVSGRSASWGHFFLTHFPITVAIMESGGAICCKGKNGQIITEVLATEDDLLCLQKSEKLFREKYPLLEMAQDNTGRITDRAIELYSLKELKVLDAVQKDLKEQKLHYTISNVHLNYSTTQNNKWSGVQYVVEKMWKKNLNKLLKSSAFIGDAPNDECMFKEFPISVGVGNLKPYLKTLKYRPAILMKECEIKGALAFLKRSAKM